MSNVTGRGWPTKRLPDQFGAPSNAAVGSVPDLPKARNSAAATSAMDILADAVWRIDALDHQNAGAPAKVVRNLGTAGSVLDCRTGSTSVPDTNDPMFLPAEQSAYVYLPGVANNWLSIPDATNLRITGDLTLTAQIAMDNWVPSASMVILAKRDGANTQSAYALTLLTSGKLRFQWSANGTTFTNNDSIVAPTVAAGQKLFVAVTFNVNDGSSQNVTRFFTSPDGSTWTQLGDPITKAGTATIFAGTAPVTVGADSASGLWAAMKTYRVTIATGIGASGVPGGTTVLDVDTSVLTTGSATSFTAATGQTVTINRATSGRKSVVVPSADVKKVDDANVYLPGVAGNSMSVPHVAGKYVGDVMDVRADLNMDSFATTQIMGKGDSLAAGAGSWTLDVVTGGSLRFRAYDSTTGSGVATSSAVLPIPTGTRCRVRATYTRNTGAGQYAVDFYYSFNTTTSIDADTSWVALGTTQTGTSIGAMYESTQSVFIGAYRASTAGVPGKYYAASVAVSGTTNLNIDCTVAPTNFTPGYASAFPAVTGQTVTMNSTAGSAMRVNGERFASGSPVWLFGTDDYMEVPLSATGSKLLDFGPNDSFTVLAVARQWGTIPSNGNNILIKRNQRVSVQALGWAMSFLSNSQINGTIWDNYQRTTVSQASAPFGTTQTVLVVRNVGRKILQANSNALSTSASDVTGDITGPSVVTIGRISAIPAAGASADYGDFEFVTAAVFRRALSAAEISTLTTYYQQKVA